jgi:hypothetical protein
MRHGMGSMGNGPEMKHKTMYCQRGAAHHYCGCGMMSRQSNLNFGFAPIPPTLLSSLKVLTPPPISPSRIARVAQGSNSGFLPDLLQPPRA